MAAQEPPSTGKTTSSFPPLATSRDTYGHPLFRSVAFRWFWRFYTWRLTDAGRWLLWPMVGFFLYTSASLEFQSFIPLSYMFGLWVVALSAAVLCRPRVKLRVCHADRVCAGETLPVDVFVERTGGLGGIGLQVLPHRLPLGVDALPEEGTALPELKAGQQAKARLGLYCGQRGVHRLKAFRAETDFPFGVFRSYSVFPHDRTLLVYPSFMALKRLGVPLGRRYQPGGVSLASVVGDAVEYVGNREFRDGDSVRDIDWRATARLNRPIVREYREEYLLRVAVILDTHVPREAPAARRASFERGVSLCAAVGEYLARQEHVVDIFAAGPNLYHLMAGRSLAYLDQILDILACVEENPVEPFDAIAPELLENLARISAVVCVFLDWTESRRAFAESLRQQGAGLKLAIAAEGPCTLDPAADEAIFGPIPVFSRADFERGIEEM